MRLKLTAWLASSMQPAYHADALRCSLRAPTNEETLGRCLPERDVSPDIEQMALYSGQSCSSIDAVQAAAEIVSNIVRSASAAIDRLTAWHEQRPDHWRADAKRTRYAVGIDRAR